MSNNKKTKTSRSTFQGRKIVMKEDDMGIEVEIDGKPVPISKAGGKYSTTILPHIEFDDPSDAAKALIGLEGKFWGEPSEEKDKKDD